MLGGEFEPPLVALAEALSERGRSTVPGRRRRGPARASPSSAPRLPSRRSRDALPPLERYARLVDGGETRASPAAVEASRGCLHRCRHCPIPPVYGGRFFVVPREVVLRDMRDVVAARARATSRFADPDFLNGPRHALAIVRALHGSAP